MDLKHEPHWNKAALMLSLRQGEKLPVACGCTSVSAHPSELAKQPSIQIMEQAVFSVHTSTGVAGDPLHHSGFTPASTDCPLLLSTF